MPYSFAMDATCFVHCRRQSAFMVSGVVTGVAALLQRVGELLIALIFKCFGWVAEWSKAAVLKSIAARSVHHPENAGNSLFPGLFFTSASSACTLYKGAEKGANRCQDTRSRFCTPCPPGADRNRLGRDKEEKSRRGHSRLVCCGGGALRARTTILHHIGGVPGIMLVIGWIANYHENARMVLGNLSR